MPRLPILALEEMPEKIRSMITGGKSELSAKNINKMVAHAENSARHFMRLGNYLLTQFLSHRELVELTLVIGFYNLVARFLENTGVEIES